MGFRAKIAWSLAAALSVGVVVATFHSPIFEWCAHGPKPLRLLSYLLIFPAFFAGSGNFHFPVLNPGAVAGTLGLVVFAPVFSLISFRSRTPSSCSYSPSTKRHLIGGLAICGLVHGPLMMIACSMAGFLFITHENFSAISLGSSLGASAVMGLALGTVVGTLVGFIESSCSPDKWLEAWIRA